MPEVDQEVLRPNVLSLSEHVDIIKGHQQRIKDAIFDFVSSVSIAFDQLGPDIFERDLAKELGMSASTLNRWKSIGSSQIISENSDSIPPVFSSLYEISQLEKLYVKEKGDTQGRQEVQKLINRGSISQTTETKDIRFFRKNLKREVLDEKKRLKEETLLNHSGQIGYTTEKVFSHLEDCIDSGLKVRTIVLSPPNSFLTRWGDPGVLRSDINAEFPLAELRGKSESQSITCLLNVPNQRIDVAIKILNATGFNYRRTFFHLLEFEKGNVVVYGQRGSGGKVYDDEPKTLIELAEQIGHKPFISLFDWCDREDWISIPEPI